MRERITLPCPNHIMLSTLLLLFLAQDPGSGLDDLRAQAADLAPAAVLQLADDTGMEAGDALFQQAAAAVDSATGKELLLIVRMLSWSGEPAQPERLVTLLPEGGPLAEAALATLGLEAFRLDEAAQSALGSWLGEQVVEDAPRLWLEAQATLYRIGDGTRRRAALRGLRGLLMDEDPAVRDAAALALGRTGTPLGAREIELIDRIALGVGPQAELAASLLERVEEQERFRAKIEALMRVQAIENGDTAAGQPVEGSDMDVLVEVLRRAEEQHMEGDRFDRQELLDAAADGLLRRLDPYSSYFSGEDYQAFMFEMSGSYGGIGAYVRTVDGVFTLIRPIYSGPAYQVGLRSGDKVLEVDGWSTVEQPDDEIIKRLKGEPGTVVSLNVFRAGWSEPRDIAVVRDRIAVPVLQHEMLPGRVLYLELLDFSSDVGARIAQQIQDALAEGPLNGVVLDLRNNPGGYMLEAVNLCDVFLPAGKVVVSTKSRTEPEESYSTRAPALVPEDVPLAVLINEYSASASEIVAGALSVHGRATTVGMRTHGKGSVQQLLPLRARRDERFRDENGNRRWDEWEEYEDANGNGSYDYGPRVKLTLSYYYLPDGSSIHTLRDHDGRVTQEGGVQPELEVAFTQPDFATLRELERLVGDDMFQDYAQRIHDEDIELAVELAEYDGRDVARYPGFADWKSTLQTGLDDQELRRWVRRRLRDLVSDDRGKVFPGNGFQGDFLEDPQLGAAIRKVLAARALDAGSVPEYAELLARAAAAERPQVR